jgi:hypothetical protein
LGEIFRLRAVRHAERKGAQMRDQGDELGLECCIIDGAATRL